MITLQINTAGAWKNVVQFDESQREGVLDGLKGLAQALGPKVTWCLVDENGKREWLHDIHSGAFPGWDDITPTWPAPLQDMLVSAYDESEGKGVVFMAWRASTNPDRWVLSGSEEPLLMPVYACGPIMEPAPVPAHLHQQVAA